MCTYKVEKLLFKVVLKCSFIIHIKDNTTIHDILVFNLLKWDGIYSRSLIVVQFKKKIFRFKLEHLIK